MFKAIMAVDDKGGISRDGSMPWPKNSSDLKWFKKNTYKAQIILKEKNQQCLLWDFHRFYYNKIMKLLSFSDYE